MSKQQIPETGTALDFKHALLKFGREQLTGNELRSVTDVVGHGFMSVIAETLKSNHPDDFNTLWNVDGTATDDCLNEVLDMVNMDVLDRDGFLCWLSEQSDYWLRRPIIEHFIERLQM